MSSIVDAFMRSKEIKRTIVKLSTEHSLPLKYIAADIGMDYHYFMRSYINALDHFAFKISDAQIKRLFELLGIDVRLQFVINSEHKYSEVQKLLKERHGFKAYWDNQEKGIGNATEGVDNFLD